MTEPELVKETIERLTPDFQLWPEVTGKHLAYGDEVRIDLIAKPKRPLIEEGFPDEYFGIECKLIGSHPGRAAKAVYQSMTYGLSEFEKDGTDFGVPRFVLVQSEIGDDKSRDLVKQYIAVGLYGRVGYIDWYPQKCWCFKFAYIFAKKESEGYRIVERQLPNYRIGNVG